MNRSFYNGISGIKTHQSGIDTWGNNISNINTIGYKANMPEFGTIFSQALADRGNSPTDDQIGLGSRLDSTAISMAQGSLQKSDNFLDLAVEGDGWFGVSGINNQMFFTRDGSFSTDADGYVVNANGNYLLGSSANNISLGMDPSNPGNQIHVLNKSVNSIELGSVGAQSKLQLPAQMYYPAKASTFATLKANLPADANINQSYDIRAGLIAPDGSKHTLTVTLTKAATQPQLGTSWNYHAFIDDAATPSAVTDGTLNFDERGGLSAAPASFTIDNHGGAVKVTLGTSAYDGLTSIAGADISSSSKTDGYISGHLNGYDIDQNANIVAAFDNGRSSTIGKIALYHFQNDQGLEKAGSNLYTDSSNSGKPIFYKDSSGKSILGAKIADHELENSNVSLASALTELIVMQKAFDASAKSITTSDQMIQKAINMKK